MRRIRHLVAGATLGSLLTYLFDPERGRSRRTQLTQRSAGMVRRIRRQAQRQLTSATSQAAGLKERVAHLEVEDRNPTEEKLKDRVQSELFRAPDIPKGDININVENGVVMLRGHVDSDAMRERLEVQARRIQGVERVENLIRVTA